MIYFCLTCHDESPTLAGNRCKKCGMGDLMRVKETAAEVVERYARERADAASDAWVARHVVPAVA